MAVVGNSLPGIKEITQAIAQQVQSGHGEGDADAGINGEPGRRFHIVATGSQE